MRRQRYADQHRDRTRGHEPERHADEERRAQKQDDKQQIDRQHRHLTGEEAAQHVELTQAFGDDARRRALEMTIGQLHQMVNDFGAHQRVEVCASPGRQPAAPHPERKIEGVDAQHGRRQHGHHRHDALQRALPDHAIEHQHHENRRGEAEQVDEQRCHREPGDYRPHARP